MFVRVSLLVLLQVVLSSTAPLQLPLLQPLQGTLQQQQLALQEQMLAVQQFQALQRFNAMPPPMMMNSQQPLLLLIPNEPSINELDNRFTKLNENFLKEDKPTQGIEDDESDSITIDAEPENNEIDDVNVKNSPMRAILLVPNNNARFSIGGFISSIPFLPFEINVPDSISWIYNGISGIISGIGQSWPFNRPNGEQPQMKGIWKDWKTKKFMPIVVVPLGQPMVPMQM